MYNRIVCIIFSMFINTMMVAQNNGAIKGKVVEYRTKQPLAGATIAIREKDFVAVTDSTGIFIIPNLSAGTYTVTITNIGFYDKTLNDINVVAGKTYYFETELTAGAIKLNEDSLILSVSTCGLIINSS